MNEYEVLKAITLGEERTIMQRVATLHAPTAEKALEIAKRKGFILPIIGLKEQK